MSKDLECWLITQIKVPERKISQLYNGVDLKQFKCRTIKPVELLPENFRSKIETIKAKNQDSFELVLDEGPRKLLLLWGTNSDLNLKIKVYEALIALKENSKIVTVDVSAPHAPIVK